MACLQLLKPSPSYSHVKFGGFSVKRGISFQSSRIVLDRRRFGVSCKAEDNESNVTGEEPPESLFMKELRKRGMTPASLLEEKNRSSEKSEEKKFREEDGGWNYTRSNGVRTDAELNLINQREKSMALNSEGIEGLIPRAKLLLTLGATFFMAFWPLILVTVASFTICYLYFGPQFVHDGSDVSVSIPQYVDPYALLEEQRIYKTAPLIK